MNGWYGGDATQSIPIACTGLFVGEDSLIDFSDRPNGSLK